MQFVQLTKQARSTKEENALRELEDAVRNAHEHRQVTEHSRRVNAALAALLDVIDVELGDD